MPPDSKALENQPVLFSGLQIYYQAFQDLFTEKQTGFAGSGVIPWSSILKWGKYHQVDDVDKLMRYIRALETARNEAIEKKNKRG